MYNIRIQTVANFVKHYSIIASNLMKTKHTKVIKLISVFFTFISLANYAVKN